MMSFYQERYFLHLALKCSACHRSINRRHAEFLVEEDSAQLVFVSCPFCDHSQMLVIVETDRGWETIGLQTDLDRDEIELLFRSERVSPDEVLRLHQMLRSRQGSKAMISSLIKHRQTS